MVLIAKCGALFQPSGKSHIGIRGGSPMNFEERLNALVDEFIAGPDTRQEVISALELVLMRLKEEAADE
jgi:hypothetical protein